MSLFPNTIRIQVFYESNKKPIPNVAIMIKLFARHKNDYYFLLPLTDESGGIKVTRVWFEEGIKKDADLFAMDYASSLDDCLPQIKIAVLDEEELTRTVGGLIRFKKVVGTSDDEINKYKNAVNPKYISFIKNVKLDGSICLYIDIPLREKAEES